MEPDTRCVTVVTRDGRQDFCEHIPDEHHFDNTMGYTGCEIEGCECGMFEPEEPPDEED